MGAVSDPKYVVQGSDSTGLINLDCWLKPSHHFTVLARPASPILGLTVETESTDYDMNMTVFGVKRLDLAASFVEGNVAGEEIFWFHTLATVLHACCNT